MNNFKNLKTILYPNKILRTECSEVQDFNSLDLRALYKEMKRILKEDEGVGLAAPQLGIPLKILLVSPPDDEKDYFLINPHISFFSKKKAYALEGCLSLPGIFGSVLRPQKIKIKAVDINGEKIALNAKTMLARILQHEIDHLNGVLFIDKADQILEGADKLAVLQNESKAYI